MKDQTTTVNELAQKHGADRRTVKRILTPLKPNRIGRFDHYPTAAAEKLMAEHRQQQRATSDDRKENIRLKNEKLAVEIGLLKGKFIDREELAGRLRGLCTEVNATLIQQLTVAWPAAAAGLPPDELRALGVKTHSAIVNRFKDFAAQWKATDDTAAK